MDCCFHNLVATFHSTVSSAVATNPEAAAKLATANTQAFIERIFDLPRETADEGTLAVLDDEHLAKFKLPRAHPLPSPKAPSKWDSFSKKKDIRKRKKSALVYDEADDSWKLNRGLHSLKNTQRKREILIEHKPGSDDKIDPFKLRDDIAKLGKAKQKMQEIRNVVSQAGYKMAEASNVQSATKVAPTAKELILGKKIRKPSTKTSVVITKPKSAYETTKASPKSRKKQPKLSKLAQSVKKSKNKFKR